MIHFLSTCKIGKRKKNGHEIGGIGAMSLNLYLINHSVYSKFEDSSLHSF